jgi:hypothetical protein
VGLGTKQGFRVYELDVGLTIVEGDDFALPTKSVIDMAFMGEGMNLLLLLEGGSVWSWSEEHVNRVGMLASSVVESVSYCYPMLICSIGSTIVVYNMIKDVVYRYIPNVSSMFSNYVFNQSDMTRKRERMFMESDDILLYFNGPTIMLENLPKQLVMGVNRTSLE